MMGILKTKIMLTGATGFLGKHVLSELCRQDYVIAAYIRDASQASLFEPYESVKSVPFNIESSTQDSFEDGSVLIHLAWGGVRDTLSNDHLSSWQSHYLFIRNAVTSGVKKVVVAGTCYEYGMSYGPVSADACASPITPYAIAKNNLHNALRLLQQETDFELIWARIFYVYGPGQSENSILSQFEKAINIGVDEFPMSFGEQLLDYSSVEDVAKMLVKLVDQPDGVYNVCSGTPISLRRFLELRASRLGAEIKLKLGVYDYRKHESLAMWGANPMIGCKFNFAET